VRRNRTAKPVWFKNGVKLHIIKEDRNEEKGVTASSSVHQKAIGANSVHVLPTGFLPQMTVPRTPSGFDEKVGSSVLVHKINEPSLLRALARSRDDLKSSCLLDLED
jgi:hypothetical protein